MARKIHLLGAATHYRLGKHDKPCRSVQNVSQTRFTTIPAPHPVRTRENTEQFWIGAQFGPGSDVQGPSSACATACTVPELRRPGATRPAAPEPPDPFRSSQAQAGYLPHALANPANSRARAVAHAAHRLQSGRGFSFRSDRPHRFQMRPAGFDCIEAHRKHRLQVPFEFPPPT